MYQDNMENPAKFSKAANTQSWGTRKSHLYCQIPESICTLFKYLLLLCMSIQIYLSVFHGEQKPFAVIMVF